ncbi:unnamed protein product [Protopolystoma xenopodis]|uniref:G-protein coupled receptors family 1 profile domain-containing protein n=1 Tax=Protopolystoma xenopodis TaxID=117903 RepID=A0A3S5C605_9PLAT|nr:unnamed protein product [Protopolystoma xenopodis]
MFYIASWTPYGLVALYALLHKERHFLSPFVAEFTVLFAKTSAVYNPILYAFTHHRFRLEISAFRQQLKRQVTCAYNKLALRLSLFGCCHVQNSRDKLVTPDARTTSQVMEV